MIFTDRTIIVQKGTSSINDTIVLYRGDRDIEIRFTLNEGSPFKFGSGASPNIIEKTEAAYGQLVIKTPNNHPAIFSEIAPTNEGKIVFTITGEMIDEITEVGNYTFQIRLLDENKQSRVTIPEVKDGIEIREPIAMEGEDTTNIVGLATVGNAIITSETSYAVLAADTSEDTFDAQGNYNKTAWVMGDKITAEKLNKIEAGIDGVNQKVANSGEIDLSGYVTKETGNANQITFADGQTFQAKLDTGILKGDKGDPGESGADNIDDTTASTTTTYSSNKVESIVDIERKRIDTFTKLSEAATSADAEIIDARIGIDKTYLNVGAHIRNLGNILFNNFINLQKGYNLIDLSSTSSRVLVSQTKNKIVNTQGSKVVINDNENEIYSYAVIRVIEGEKFKWEGFHVDSNYANIGIVYTTEDDTIVLRDIPTDDTYISTVPSGVTKAYLGLQDTTNIKTKVYESEYIYSKKKIILSDLEEGINEKLSVIFNNMLYAKNLWTLGNQTKTSSEGKWQYLIIKKTLAEMDMQVGETYVYKIGDYKVFETGNTYCANVEQYNSSNTKITNKYYYLTDNSIEFTIDSNCSYLQFVFCLNVDTELTGEFTAYWNDIKLFTKELYDKYGENYKISKDILEMSNGNDNEQASYPDYYIDYIKEKLTSIRSLDSEVGSNGDSFVFITDCHFEDNACNSQHLIKKIISDTGVNKVIYGGDSFNISANKDEVRKCLKQTRNRFNYLDNEHFFMTVGNHDYNNPASSTDSASLAIELSSNELYPFVIKEYESNCIIYNKINYYFDNKAQKIRYFSIGCNKSSQIEQESVTWLLNELKNVPNGYSIVLIFHSFGDVADGAISTSWRSKIIVDAIDCYNNKTSYTYVEDGNTYDYSTAQGKVILVMFGHVHADASMTTTTNVPVVCTTCDAYRQEHGGLTRTKGTINEQAFDVVHINTNTRKINLTRIGAGGDREFNY